MLIHLLVKIFVRPKSIFMVLSWSFMNMLREVKNLNFLMHVFWAEFEQGNEIACLLVLALILYMRVFFAVYLVPYF